MILNSTDRRTSKFIYSFTYRTEKMYFLLVALFFLQLGYDFIERFPLCLVLPVLLLVLFLAGIFLV